MRLNICLSVCLSVPRRGTDAPQGLSLCTFWPACSWVKALEAKAGLRVVKAGDSSQSVLRALEGCLRLGTPLLLEDVGESLDPLLRPLLHKQTFKQASKALLGSTHGSPLLSLQVAATISATQQHAGASPTTSFRPRVAQRCTPHCGATAPSL
jgi:ATP-binding dynein motor region